jgi:hypothetical protein
MIYVTNTTTSAVDCYVYESSVERASTGVERKWLEEVLPHYFAPASRQRTLDSSSMPPAMLADADVDLDSPPFTPCELTEFAARGFARRNRWAAGERKR